MAQTFILSIGSNINRTRNIRKAKSWLFEITNGDIKYSPTIGTEPVGIKTARFQNLVCTGSVNLSYDELRQYTKAIERLCGNTVEKKKSSVVELDIDILRFGDELFHEEDWKRDYIQELIKGLQQSE